MEEQMNSIKQFADSAVAWYVKCIKLYVTFTGRARRAEYWMFCLTNFVIATLIGLIGFILNTDILSTLYGLFVFIPNIAVGVRRLHDIGKSGWGILLGCIPVANFYLLYLLLRRGDKMDNRYGIAQEA